MGVGLGQLVDTGVGSDLVPIATTNDPDPYWQLYSRRVAIAGQDKDDDDD